MEDDTGTGCPPPLGVVRVTQRCDDGRCRVDVWWGSGTDGLLPELSLAGRRPLEWVEFADRLQQAYPQHGAPNLTTQHHRGQLTPHTLAEYVAMILRVEELRCSPFVRLWFEHPTATLESIIARARHLAIAADPPPTRAHRIHAHDRATSTTASVVSTANQTAAAVATVAGTLHDMDTNGVVSMLSNVGRSWMQRSAGWAGSATSAPAFDPRSCPQVAFAVSGIDTEAEKARATDMSASIQVRSVRNLQLAAKKLHDSYTELGCAYSMYAAALGDAGNLLDRAIPRGSMGAEAALPPKTLQRPPQRVAKVAGAFKQENPLCESFALVFFDAVAHDAPVEHSCLPIRWEDAEVQALPPLSHVAFTPGRGHPSTPLTAVSCTSNASLTAVGDTPETVDVQPPVGLGTRQPSSTRAASAGDAHTASSLSTAGSGVASGTGSASASPHPSPTSDGAASARSKGDAAAAECASPPPPRASAPAPPSRVGGGSGDAGGGHRNASGSALSDTPLASVAGARASSSQPSTSGGTPAHPHLEPYPEYKAFTSQRVGIGGAPVDVHAASTSALPERSASASTGSAAGGSSAPASAGRRSDAADDPSAWEHATPRDKVWSYLKTAGRTAAQALAGSGDDGRTHTAHAVPKNTPAAAPENALGRYERFATPFAQSAMRGRVIDGDGVVVAGCDARIEGSDGESVVLRFSATPEERVALGMDEFLALANSDAGVGGMGACDVDAVRREYHKVGWEYGQLGGVVSRLTRAELVANGVLAVCRDHADACDDAQEGVQRRMARFAGTGEEDVATLELAKQCTITLAAVQDDAARVADVHKTGRAEVRACLHQAAAQVVQAHQARAASEVRHWESVLTCLDTLDSPRNDADVPTKDLLRAALGGHSWLSSPGLDDTATDPFGDPISEDALAALLA